MTPTPQERTELQRLAERLRATAEHGDDGLRSLSSGRFGLPDRLKTDLNAAAAAIDSLAAQSEELRAENEFLKRDYKEVLRAGLGDAKHDTDVNHDEALLILRAHLEAFNERAEREVLDRALDDMQAWQTAHKDPIHDLIEAHSKLAALESRYSALVTASRKITDYFDGNEDVEAEVGSFPEVLVDELRRVLGALLDSEASQGGNK